MKHTIKQSLRVKIWNLEEEIQNDGKPHIADLDKLTQKILKECSGTGMVICEEGGRTIHAYSLNKETITKLVDSYGAPEYINTLKNLVEYVMDGSQMVDNSSEQPNC